MKKTMGPPPPGVTASQMIDARIQEAGGWRGELLAQARRLILAADPAIVEDWKWGGPVWSCRGVLCTGEVYKTVVKLTFAKGASAPDPTGLFNASLAGATRRAIDLPEGTRIDAAAFTALIRAAVAVNADGKPKSVSARGPAAEG